MHGCIIPGWVRIENVTVPQYRLECTPWALDTGAHRWTGAWPLLDPAFAPLIPGEDLLTRPDLHIRPIGDMLEDAPDMLRPMRGPHDIGVHREAQDARGLR